MWSTGEPGQEQGAKEGGEQGKKLAEGEAGEDAGAADQIADLGIGFTGVFDQRADQAVKDQEGG